MPRGGRRRRAGAPRGNLNALTNGNHSRRMWEVAVALKTLVKRWDEPKLRAIANAVREAGLGGPGVSMRANIPASIQLESPRITERTGGSALAARGRCRVQKATSEQKTTAASAIRG